MYNQMTDAMIIDSLLRNSPQLATGFQLVRLYATVNVAMAEAAIAVRRSCHVDEHGVQGLCWTLTCSSRSLTSCCRLL